MTEVRSASFNIGIGKLQADIELTLNSPHAAKIWLGRPASYRKNLARIAGIEDYFHAVYRIVESAKLDDPYGDWWLMLVENKIDQAEHRIKQVDAALNGRLATVPKQLRVGESTNYFPFRTPVNVDSPQGFIGLYQLIAFDKLALKIDLARRLAAIDSNEVSMWGRYAAGGLRHLFFYAQSFYHSGANRQDFQAMNARAQRALARLGPLPPEVLEGAMRSKFSPRYWRAMPMQPVEGANETLWESLARTVHEASADEMVSDLSFDEAGSTDTGTELAEGIE
jgi:integrating conjugative element protein (TIGR03761 family)